MENYCAFSKNHKCIKWMDYELTRHKLEEADSLCHENWIEIQHLYDRIHFLESILADAGSDVPNNIFNSFLKAGVTRTPAHQTRPSKTLATPQKV